MEFKQIHTAPSGEAALNLFKEYGHDLIITDWQMSPMDGVELARFIRTQNGETPNRKVPIIVSTGFTNIKMINEARDAGVTEFLVKPFSADDLAKRITYVMNKPRPFVEEADYIGPDRRRIKKKGFDGPYKRKEDA